MQESIQQTLFEGYTGLLKPAPFWNETNLDWADSEYSAKAHLPLNVRQGEGWLWLQGSVNVEGHLIGGCIEVLEMLKGTRWWPKPAMFKKAVLYLETSNDVPPPANVEYWLRNHASQGILNEISALFLARARDYTPAMKDQLHTSILKVLAEVGREEMPVIANMDIGHTMPMMVMPNGCKVFIDAKQREISLLEAGVI